MPKLQTRILTSSLNLPAIIQAVSEGLTDTAEITTEIKSQWFI